MHAHMQSIQNSTITTAKAPEVISIPQNKVKLPNSPTGAKIWCTGEVDGLPGNTSDKLLSFSGKLAT